MTFDQIIIWVIAAGVVIGAADKIFGNRLGLAVSLTRDFRLWCCWPWGWLESFCLGSCDCGCVRPRDYSGI